MTNASAASSRTLEDKIKAQARYSGFDLVGIAPAAEPASWHYYQDWLTQGYAGQMHYMHHQAQARSHPRHVFPQVRSIILVGLNYKPKRLVSQQILPAHVGRVSAYAQSRDYHRVLRKKLEQLLRWLQQEVPDCQGRAVVDSAPLLERDFARRAGLGWFGKNTMLINKRLGSFFFLGALLVSIPLQPDPPLETNHCGSCTACLDACPTQALIAPYTLDARRCISYLTIELRGPIPREMRSKLGDWMFGCDICQDVCPWNRKSPVSQCPELRPRPDLEQLDLYQLFFLTEEEFTRKFAGTPLLRARRDGLLRNAAVVLGNRKDPSAVPALQQGLNDPSPIVRQAAAWALGRIATAEALAALRTHLPQEQHPGVREEIYHTLYENISPS
ncbi:MAG: tRNA epoxyqueuosine(34) reductase QueG [Gemmatales bacterium]|nr:tRNA epoxyqueuosine(34) reductase QueG [Gemmatales bacterium]